MEALTHTARTAHCTFEMGFLKRDIYPGGRVRTMQFYGPIQWTTHTATEWTHSGVISEWYANRLEERLFARGHVEGITVNVERAGIVTRGLAIHTPPFGTVVTQRQSWRRATAREFFMYLARAPFRERAYRTFARILRRRRAKRALTALLACGNRIGGRMWQCTQQGGAIRIRLLFHLKLYDHHSIRGATPPCGFSGPLAAETMGRCSVSASVMAWMHSTVAE